MSRFVSVATRKKMSEAHKGHLASEETRTKMSEARKGRPVSQETRKKISDTLMGHPVSQETREKISKANRGFKPSAETRKKLSKLKNQYWADDERSSRHRQMLRELAPAGAKSRKVPKGANHYNWKGGISFELYPPEFNEALRLGIRKRDDYACQKCGKLEAEEKVEFNRVLSVHHVNGNKKNNEENNLITLCLRCNIKASGNGSRHWQLFFKGLLRDKEMSLAVR